MTRGWVSLLGDCYRKREKRVCSERAMGKRNESVMLGFQMLHACNEFHVLLEGIDSLPHELVPLCSRVTQLVIRDH